MKHCLKYLSILLITGLVFATGSSAIAQQYYRVTVDGLNIRSGPGKNYNTITVALKGDTLEAIHDLKGWMEVVAIKNNTRGFVAAQMIEKIDVKDRPGSGGFWSFIGKLFKWLLIIIVLYFLYKWIRAKLDKPTPPVKKTVATVPMQTERIPTETIVSENDPVPPVVNAVEEHMPDYIPLAEGEDKGDAFEQFIIKKLSKNPSLSIKRWRSDKYVEGIFAQSNKHPDFEIMFSGTKNGEKINRAFGLECKWRHYFFNDKIELESSLLNNYKQYAEDENKPVYLVIGVGGKASDPETLFLVPLKDVENNNLDREFLMPYNCGADDEFYYDAEGEKLELRQ
ncbi:SH3 domain-containing protein [Danxiaibacter flavus]|uniref:SH3 domain-containing protein n=1 Tax=Danxiaibacter flavus TaxID=3049108 RepID=A0ABV3ZFL9_9BACT|nr:SH3 domain-containing protein [Chitinophagaceae bacterium DXS]